jgi:tRNA-dependent cyclodipeptide synthase
MDTKPYPIIGMSPGNSYFKDVEIRHLLKETVDRFGRTCVFVADVPAIATYLAYGYPENKARTKAIPKGNNLKNRTRRLAQELGYEPSQVRIVEWATEVADNPSYRQIYDLRVKKLYDSSVEFSRSVDLTTQNVLESSDRPIPDLYVATKIAVHYLLSELAFLEFAPQLLDSSHVTYVYHRNWPVYEDYISGKFDGQIRPHLHFLLLENPYETFKPLLPQSNADGASALSRVEHSRVLKVAYDDYFPAFITNPETGTHSGIFADLLAEFARSSGWAIEWTEEVGYGVISEGLSAGRYDIFGSTVWPTPERLGTALFSIPLYFSNVYAWKSGSDNRSYVDVRRSPFLRIAIKDGDISHSIAAAEFPNARLIRVPQLADPMSLLTFVSEGRADITFVEPVLAKHFRQETGRNIVRVQDLGCLRKFPNTFMSSLGQETLLETLNKFITGMIENGSVAKLIEKYLGSSDALVENMNEITMA